MAETAEATQANQETKEVDVPEEKHPLSNFGKDLVQEGEIEVADPTSEASNNTESTDNKEASKTENTDSEYKTKGEASEKGDDDSKDDAKEDESGEDKDNPEGKSDESEEEKKDEDSSKEGEETEGDGSDEIKLEIPKGDEEKKDETWSDIGNELDIEVSGKDFSDFKEGLEKKIDSVKEETKSDVLSELKEDPTSLMDELDEQSKLIFQYSLKGGKIADLLTPTKQLDDLLVMSNEDLVKAEYEGQGLSETEAQDKVQSLVDNGEIETQAKILRNQLVQAREGAIEKAINEYNDIIESEEIDSEAQEQEADKLFRDELTSRQDLHGVKLEQEHKDYVTKMWNEGKVHELFNDPKAVVDFMLEQTFGEQIRKRQSEIAYNKGRDETKKAMHEIPPTDGATTSRSEVKPSSEKEGFEKWDDLKEEEQIEIEYERR